MLGVPDRPSDVTDVAFIGTGIAVGALIGALRLEDGRSANNTLNRWRRAHLWTRFRVGAVGASQVWP